ncbi:MAG: hypothetical protein AAFX87_19075 [Bacteroidota bacterium]
MNIQNLSRLVVFLTLASVFGACCSCTDQLCITPVATITIILDLDDFQESDTEDFQNVLVKRTDQSFNAIDTAMVNLAFNPITQTTFGTEVNSILFDNQMFDLRDFNYIIINDRLDRSDTISQISYEVSESREVCNDCTGLFCGDDEFTQRTFSNPSFELNGGEVNSFEISYEPS